MDVFYSRPGLAKVVLEKIKESWPVTRAQLNQHFKSSNNIKRTDALSDVIRSLIAYNHIDRFLETDSNDLFFWPKNEKCQYTAMPNNINKDAVPDYIAELERLTARRNRPRQEEETVEERLPTPAIIPVGAGDVDEPDEEEEGEENEAEATDESSVSENDETYLYKQAKIISIDDFLVLLATKKDYFTREDLDDYLGLAKPKQSITLRVTLACRKKHIAPFRVGSEIRFALPNKVPTSAEVVGEEAFQHKVNTEDSVPKKPRRKLNSAVVIRDAEEVLMPEAKFSSKEGFQFFRANGSQVYFTEREQEVLFKFFLVTNPQALLNHLKEQK